MRKNLDQTWKNPGRLLCVRLDNMGDVLMSSPAIRALHETFQCPITLLTSSMAAALAPSIPGIDEVLVFDVPWLKSNKPMDRHAIKALARKLQGQHYSGAIIFTTFSQSPLPVAVLLFEAGITHVLAYCRENPYGLISDWIPEHEPHHFIRHQVQRDLALVSHIGAAIANDRLMINMPEESVALRALQKLWSAGLFPDRPWIVVHTGVSEPKREYAREAWIEACQEIVDSCDVQIVLTGSGEDAGKAQSIARAIRGDIFSLAGDLSLEEFITVVQGAHLVVSVNTVTAHLAAAVQTPVVVLYALTNPQHTPWRGKGFVLPFSVQPGLESRNEVLRYAKEMYYPDRCVVSPHQIAFCVEKLLSHEADPFIPPLAIYDAPVPAGVKV